ncbi:MAG: carboxylating nicotinate-nucleotide diphosphorylase [Gemmatimonadota bacterium]|nr:MAG: carboxylating nicotinate-nucleotide diphosphorylase [Gemmatimonadota bacterium]
MRLNFPEVVEIVRVALVEDIGPGDVTTQCTVPEAARSSGKFVAKGEGIIAGLDVVREVYCQVDGHLDYVPFVEDGHQARRGDVLAEVSGPARGILTAERTALNFLQRLSGIASLTHQYVEAIAGTGAEILDTRKTTPGLRTIEKYAVRVGGGRNHRTGLYDMVLIKDNHLRIAGSFQRAVAQCREIRSDVFIEVEVRNMTEVRQALKVGVDRIMLDNMGLDAIREAVALIRQATVGGQGTEIEASGGINLENVRCVAETGVDFISVGALTHSVKALDISFNVV